MPKKRQSPRKPKRRRSIWLRNSLRIAGSSHRALANPVKKPRQRWQNSLPIIGLVVSLSSAVAASWFAWYQVEEMREGRLLPIKAEVFTRRLESYRDLSAKYRKVDKSYYEFYFLHQRIKSIAGMLSRNWPAATPIEKKDNAKNLKIIKDLVGQCKDISAANRAIYQDIVDDIAEQSNLWGYKQPDALIMRFMENSYFMGARCRRLSPQVFWTRPRQAILSDLSAADAEYRQSATESEWNKLKAYMEAKLELNKVS